MFYVSINAKLQAFVTSVKHSYRSFIPLQLFSYFLDAIAPPKPSLPPFPTADSK